MSTPTLPELLAQLKADYIKLLGKELDGVVALAYAHGWRSNLYEDGEKARKQMAEATAKLAQALEAKQMSISDEAREAAPEQEQPDSGTWDRKDRALQEQADIIAGLHKALASRDAEITELRNSLRLRQRTMEDKQLLDWLEWAIWNHPETGNGIAIFPATKHVTGERSVALQGLGDEDGSNLGEELTPSMPNLREALRAARKQQEEQK